MAIALDTISEANSVSSWSHTCTGTNLVLIVGVKSVGTVTGVTYNSVAMTEIAGVAVGALTERVSMWYLANPTTGSNTIALTGGSTYTTRAASYTGAKQTGIPDAFNTQTQNNTTVTCASTITVIDTGCWMVSFMRNEGDTSSYSAGPVTTRRGSVSSIAYFDSNGTVSTGSNTATFTATSGSYNWGLVVASIAPAAESASTASFVPALSLLNVG